jgi:hypothetical protein
VRPAHQNRCPWLRPGAFSWGNRCRCRRLSGAATHRPHRRRCCRGRHGPGAAAPGGGRRADLLAVADHLRHRAAVAVVGVGQDADLAALRQVLHRVGAGLLTLWVVSGPSRQVGTNRANVGRGRGIKVRKRQLLSLVLAPVLWHPMLTAHRFFDHCNRKAPRAGRLRTGCGSSSWHLGPDPVGRLGFAHGPSGAWRERNGDHVSEKRCSGLDPLGCDLGPGYAAWCFNTRETELASRSLRLRDDVRAAPSSSLGCWATFAITRTSAVRTGSGDPWPDSLGG